MPSNYGDAATHRGRPIPKTTWNGKVFWYRPSNQVARHKIPGEASKYATTTREAWEYALKMDPEPEESFTITHKLTVEGFWDILVKAALETDTISADYFVIHDARWRLNIKPLIGNMRLTTVQPGDIRNVYTTMRGTKQADGSRVRVDLLDGSLKSGYSESAVTQARTVMNWIWDSAMSPEFAKARTSPVRSVVMGRPKKSDGRVTLDKILTSEEFGTLIEHYSDRTMYQAALYIARLTGLRIREVLALRWSDLDFEGTPRPTILVERQLPRLVVEGNLVTRPLKGDTEENQRHRRTILMPVQLKEILIAHRAWMLREGYSVFPSSLLVCNRNGSAINPSTFARSLRGACKRGAIRKGITFHCLRHTFASEAYNRGVPLRIISEHLGHESEAITAGIYINFRKQDSDFELMDAGIEHVG